MTGVLLSLDGDDASGGSDPGSVQDRLRIWREDDGMSDSEDFTVGFRLDIGDKERLPLDNFLQRMLRTDFRDTPPACGFVEASTTGEGAENSLGVGGRNADFRADFGGSFDLVKLSTSTVELE